MANAYLTAGSASMLSAAWSDASGFSTDSATLFVQSGTQNVVTLPTSTYTSAGSQGFQNVDILPGFSGTIGNASIGSLAMEAKTSIYNPSTQVPRFRYWASGGSCYYTPQGAGTATDTCDIIQIANGGAMVVTGTGTVKRVDQEGGRSIIYGTIDSVATYRWVFTGGSSTINSGSNKIHSITYSGGQHLLQRGIQGSTIAGTGFVEGLNIAGGSVTIDCVADTISELRVYGGTVTVLNCGPIAAISAYGGTLDFSKLQRPVTVTLLEDSPGCRIIPSKLLTITAYSGATNGRQPIGSGAIGLT